LNLDLCSGNGGLWVKESDPLLVSGPRGAPLDASRHHCFPISIQTSQGLQGSHGFGRENVRVGVLEVASDFQLSRCHESPLWKTTWNIIEPNGTTQQVWFAIGGLRPAVVCPRADPPLGSVFRTDP
jgi:hypothetical protein